MRNGGASPRRKSGESGFAMLLVFLMASIIAISLYIQLPRVAFDAQRQKEQLLMERGEQYKRAIQLFVRANGRYPAKIDDLENFNNRRFLRHKFKDPITGKAEWRLIHINGAGVFTDSITNKSKQGDKDQSISTTGSIAEIPELGALAGQGQGQQAVATAANRRRASEGGAAPPMVGPDGQPYPAQNPGFPGAPGGQPFPGQPGATQQPYPPGAAQQPYQPYQPPTAPADQINPAAQPGYALVNPNPQMGNNLAPGGGGAVPPELANLPGGGAQAGLPGQNGQPGQLPAQPTPLPTPFRPPVPQQQPIANSGNQSSSSIGGSSSSIGGLSSIGGGDSSSGGNSSLGGNTSSLGGAVPGQNRFFNPVPPPTQFQQPGDPAGTPITNQNPAAGFGQPNQQIANAGGGVGQGNPQANGQASNPATALINNMLTSPRQPPTGTGTAAAQPGGQQIGGGIAGVASTSEGASIMVYHDRSNYNEWEFIFDYTKQKAAPNANAGVAGTPVQNLGTTGPGTTATPNAAGFGGASPFGNNQGLGNSPGIGNTSGLGNASGLGNNSGFGNNSGSGQGTAAPTQQQLPPTDIRLGAP
jgi:type II secretory pathway pseudopilin PulG